MMGAYDIQSMFYKIYKKQISINTFEEWVYDNPSIEDIIGKEVYLDIVSINFNDRHVFHELEKLLCRHINFGEMEFERIRGLLESIITGQSDIYDLMETIYDDYCRGYTFLRFLGLSFITSGLVEEIGVPGVRENLLKRIPKYKTEAHRLLELFKDNKIKIVDEYMYSDYRKPDDRIEILDVEKMFEG